MHFVKEKKFLKKWSDFGQIVGGKKRFGARNMQLHRLRPRLRKGPVIRPFFFGERGKGKKLFSPPRRLPKKEKRMWSDHRLLRL